MQNYSKVKMQEEYLRASSRQKRKTTLLKRIGELYIVLSQEINIAIMIFFSDVGS